MADNDNSEAQAIGGLATLGVVKPAVGMTLAGNAAKVTEPTTAELAPYKGGAISEAEMKTWNEWADKTPNLLRAQLNAIPEPTGGGLMAPLISVGLGAALTVASFTSYIPGKWKIASGLGAVGAGALGLYLGSQAGDPAGCVPPEIKKPFLDYADALDRDPNLRRQLADYLAAHMTDDAVEGRPIEVAVMEKSIEFGRSAPYLDMATVKATAQGKPNGLAR